MDTLFELLTSIYSKLLHLYPRGFIMEFSAEMEVVFRDALREALKKGLLPVIFVFLKEAGELPFNILREFWHEFRRKDRAMITSAPSGQKPAVNNRAEHWMTLIGILPFLLFGITSMVAKIKLPISPAYPYMIFSATTLIGLAIGLTRGIPRWTYSYLGWAVIMSMWWTMLPIDSFGVGSSSVILHRIRFGLLAWIPLLITVVIPSILAHSFRPLKQLLAGLWQDWTLLSLGFYTFGGFIFIQFDENHHPYLFALIIATTCTIAGGVWLFMSSRGTGKRVIALFTGFILSYIVARISYATWDWAAYYGLPPTQPEPWYSKVGETTAVLVFWSALMFWPVIFGLARTLIKNQQKPGTPA